MNDTEVLVELGRIERAFKASVTRARRKFNQVKADAFRSYGSSDVEQAARENAMRRAELEERRALDAAYATRFRRRSELRERASEWSDLVPNEGGGWLYHETTREAFPWIREEGLRPTSYGQTFVGEMGEVLSPDMFDEDELAQIPVGDLVPRIYVHNAEPSALYYGEILLRFPRSCVGRLKRDVDWYTTEPVAPELIQVLLDGEWVGLR
jgi:hypothetical protein